MVAPYNPTDDDFEKLYGDLPALGISLREFSNNKK